MDRTQYVMKTQLAGIPIEDVFDWMHAGVYGERWRVQNTLECPIVYLLADSKGKKNSAAVSKYQHLRYYHTWNILLHL